MVVTNRSDYSEYRPIDRFSSTGGIKLAQTAGVAFTTVNHPENTIYCSRIYVPIAGFIEAIGLPLETPPAGATRKILIGLYDIDEDDTGYPVRILAPGSFEFTLSTSGYTTQIRNLSSSERIRITHPKNIILACRIGDTYFTDGKYMGPICSKSGNPNWTNKGDFSATVSSSTYASGLPNSWSSLSNPSYSNFETTAAANTRICNTNWILYMSPD